MRRPFGHHPVALAAALLLVAGPARAQGRDAIPARTLGPREARAASPLSSVAGVMELRDGRAVVLDRRESRLVTFDPRSGALTPLGRQGSGPREYSNPQALIPWRGDSALVLDMGNRRLLPIGPTGALGDAFPQPTGMAREGAIISYPWQSDTLGRIYYPGGFMRRGPDGRFLGDHVTTTIYRIAPGAEAPDSIAEVAIRGREFAGTPGWGNSPFAEADAWLVAPDGRIAVMVSRDYHLRWISPGGTVTDHAPVPFRRIPVTAEERDAHRTRLRENFTRRAGTIGPRDPGAIADERFPRFMPPFIGEPFRAFLTPDGEIWVERSRTHTDDVAVIEIFRADGRRVAQLALPPRTIIAGMGPASLYLLRLDDDDLGWLERYRRPR